MIVGLRDQNRAVLLSTHNLDEVERIASRVAVLRQRLLAVDTPTALRMKFFGNRVRVVINGHAGEFLPALRADGHRDVVADDGSLSIAVTEAGRDIPHVVRVLVEQGARIVAVTPEEHSLEDVYLRLVKEKVPA
jgi:ABC-2 type transport system ATP-binding protein